MQRYSKYVFSLNSKNRYPLSSQMFEKKNENHQFDRNKTKRNKTKGISQWILPLMNVATTNFLSSRTTLKSS